MDNLDKQKSSLAKVFWAVILVAILIAGVLFMVFGFNWDSPQAYYPGLDEANAYIQTQEFKDSVDEAVASRDLSLCEEFEEDVLGLACLLEGATESWVLHADESVCDAIGDQRTLAFPLDFGADYIYDFNGACVTFLSVKSMQDFCDKTLNETSRSSCSNILQFRNELYRETVERDS